MADGPVTLAIGIEALRKEHRGRRGRAVVAVDHLDLAIGSGTVFGLLGPNGSGKTTVIRCLVGLTRPTSGRCTVLGALGRAQLPEVIDRVSTLVDPRCFHPRFSARRSLDLLATMGRLDRRSVDGALDRVGLADRAEDPVETYSLGMRQRLAIAAALLKDAELLILDEPTNGLDPVGVVDVRMLIAELAREGRTVLVSSHDLSEMQITCTEVAILDRGRCVALGPVADLVRSDGGEIAIRCEHADQVELAREVLVAHGAQVRSAGSGDDELLVDGCGRSGADLNRILLDASVGVRQLAARSRTLEDVFLQATGRPMPVPAEPPPSASSPGPASDPSPARP